MFSPQGGHVPNFRHPNAAKVDDGKGRTHRGGVGPREWWTGQASPGSRIGTIQGTFSLQERGQSVPSGLLWILSAGYPFPPAPHTPFLFLNWAAVSFCPFAPPCTGLCIGAGDGNISSLRHRSLDHMSQPHAPQEKSAEPPTEVLDLELDAAEAPSSLFPAMLTISYFAVSGL